MNPQTMSNAEYRAHEGISKSQLFNITKSPLHFKYALENPQEDTPSLLFGRAAHKFVLEENDFFTEFAVAPICDRRTNEGKEIWNSFLLNSEGKDVISAEDFEKIKKMSDVVRSNKYTALLLNGEHEKSFFWKDEATGEMCKCRPDCYTDINDIHIIVDYKTTDNAETESFKRDSIKLGYDLQVGMYSEGMQICNNKDYVFMFIAQEKKPPYAINILQADEIMVKEGTQLFHELLELYHNCKITNNWYGYMGENNEVSSLGLPVWLQKQFE